MLPIRIAVGELSLDGELNDTECARAVARALPVTSEFRVWGDELHFEIPLDERPSAHPDSTVAVGDLGLWIEGGTLCVFFGPTPSSPAEDPVSAVPVTVVGTVREVEKLRAKKETGRLTLSGRNGRRGEHDG